MSNSILFDLTTANIDALERSSCWSQPSTSYQNEPRLPKPALTAYHRENAEYLASGMFQSTPLPRLQPPSPPPPAPFFWPRQNLTFSASEASLNPHPPPASYFWSRPGASDGSLISLPSPPRGSFFGSRPDASNISRNSLPLPPRTSFFGSRPDYSDASLISLPPPPRASSLGSRPQLPSRASEASGSTQTPILSLSSSSSMPPNVPVRSASNYEATTQPVAESSRMATRKRKRPDSQSEGQSESRKRTRVQTKIPEPKNTKPQRRNREKLPEVPHPDTDVVTATKPIPKPKDIKVQKRCWERLPEAPHTDADMVTATDGTIIYFNPFKATSLPENPRFELACRNYDDDGPNLTQPYKCVYISPFDERQRQCGQGLAHATSYLKHFKTHFRKEYRFIQEKRENGNEGAAKMAANRAVAMKHHDSAKWLAELAHATCDTCGKSLSRKDARERHEKSACARSSNAKQVQVAVEHDQHDDAPDCDNTADASTQALAVPDLQPSNDEAQEEQFYAQLWPEFAPQTAEGTPLEAPTIDSEPISFSWSDLCK